MYPKFKEFLSSVSGYNHLLQITTLILRSIYYLNFKDFLSSVSGYSHLLQIITLISRSLYLP
jgi:hypothetical protein